MANYQIHELTSGAINRDSYIMHDTETGGTYSAHKDTVGDAVDLANVNVAAPYDPDTTYAIGQYCLYKGDIYRCIAITTGAFDSTAWVQIVVTGEFRRVVELTSAQYSTLSSAEKNNGTLYIITDEETTATDIPYSAGVSVADKLDTIPNISISSNQNNDVLRYNSSSQNWINTPLGFKVQEFTKSYTVSANSSLSFSNDFITIPTGYKMFALLGYSTNDVNVFVPSCRPWDTGAYAFQLMNVRNTSVSNTFYVRIAFVAENWL